MENTKNEYNKSIEFYTKIINSFCADFNLYNSIIEILKPQNILELGCGSGRLFQLFSNKIPELFGIDISEEMIKKGSETYPNANFIIADITNFNLSKKFDLIIVSNGLLKHIENDKTRFETLQNAVNHLSNNGVLLIDHSPYLYYKDKTTDWINAENSIALKWFYNKENILQGYQWKKIIDNSKDILCWRYFKNNQELFHTQFTTFIYENRFFWEHLESLKTTHITLLTEYDLEGLTENGNRLIVAVSKKSTSELLQFKNQFLTNFKASYEN